MTEKDLIIQDLRRENAELRARVPQWISVNDRLPEEDKDYLVITNDFGKYSSVKIRSFAKDGETADEYALAGKKYVWYFWSGEYGYVSTNTVTHWMPLPEPPEGE